MKSISLRTGVLLVGILSVAAFATEASAATYYVARESAAASDSNPGTSSQPWRTLSKACRSVRPGDTVIVRKGNYPERMNFYGGNLQHGTAYTRFLAQPGVWFYGADTLRAPNLIIRGFGVTMPESVIDSDWTARYAFFIRSNNVRIFQNHVRDFPGVGVHGYWVKPWPSNVMIAANTFRRVNQGIVIQGQDWLVQGNEVERLVQWTTKLDCDYIRFFGDRITIRDNFLHGSRLSEIGNSHVDGFQTFPNNGWHANDVWITRNYVESFHQGAMLGVADWRNYSGYIRNLMFMNNVFVGGEIGGSWGILAAHVDNTIIEHNLFMNIRYHGVGVRFGGSARVRSNIFMNCGHQNYYAESSSSLIGGYNLVDRMPSTPLYSHPRDVVANPQLVNASNPLGPDGRPRTADDGFRLRSTSPARDIGGIGGLNVDIFKRPRVAGPRADAGPHEYTAAVNRSLTDAATPTALSGSEPIEVLLESSEPIDADTIWANVPVTIQNLVKVEWVVDEHEPNAVWVRIVPLRSWDVLARDGSLRGEPFAVSVGSADISGGEHWYVIAD